MKLIFLKINSFAKGFILWLKPGKYLWFLIGPLKLISNTLELSRWITKNNRSDILNQFYSPVTDYSRRYILYEYLFKTKKLVNEKFTYLEFGVSGGDSFFWWTKNNKNPDSKFFGFDTFEGLPEKWGVFFNKGEMIAEVSSIDDPRAKLIKGLFQNVLKSFIDNNRETLNDKLVIHLDADLYSSTLYVITSLANYLKKGDILIFDEFGVPNHEFLAFKNFIDSFYLKYELIGVVNNFGQVAFEIK
jgi:O-methyltransferase